MKIKIAIVLMFALALCIFAFAQDGKNALIEEHCSTCHSTDVVYNAKKTQQRWDSTFARMVRHGLKVTADEEKEIKAFLYTLQ